MGFPEAVELSLHLECRCPAVHGRSVFIILNEQSLPGSRFDIKAVSSGIGIHIIKIRRLNDRLISIIWIPISYVET